MAETVASKAPEKQASGLVRWTASLPTNLMSVFNPFGNDDNDSQDAASTNTSNKRSSMLSSIFPGNPSTTTESPAPTNDDESIMFAEPETRSNSDEGSCGGSVDETRPRKSKKTSNRPKTCYSLCHPPSASKTRQRLHRRPRSLLQLHRLSTETRPKPAFEVIPSANFNVRLTKAITKVFTTKHGLCPNDLVVLKAEKYSADESEAEQEARDIIALICKGRKEDGQTTGKAKICLAEGREWEAYPTLIGGYECFSTDEHGLGLTVRWVPKKGKDGSISRFNFSVISPDTRRHPVIATLSRTCLDINDTFRMPGPSGTTPLSTPRQGSTFLTEAMDEEDEGNDLYQTEDRIKDIIVMSSIWVAFKEGWSPNFKYDDKEKDAISLQRSPSLKASPSKAGTFGPSPISTPPTSPIPLTPSLEKRTSFGMWRRGSQAENRRSTASVPEEEIEQPSSPSSESMKKAGRRRADSASTVLVHRAASNRVKNQANTRQEVLASQPELQEPKASEDIPRSQSEGNILLTSASKVREGVARPVLPPAPKSENSARMVDSAASPTQKPRRKSPQQSKRVSSAASETTTSTNEMVKQSSPFVKHKKRGLRRLLCGSGDD